MICFDPLWETMKKKGVTTYTLRVTYKMSHSTVQSLQENKSVTTYTLNRLCEILDCGLEDVAKYIPDKKE
ncbi:MAG: helix-turn-helix transcriptional regulator [Bacillota bacterium]|nr:helix-turn-helix transcriptional regulator [Bacillota bacterium]